jgi:hypothetical protein
VVGESRGVGTHIVLLYKLATPADIDSQGAQDSLALTQVRFLSLLVLDVNVKRLTFQEQFEITVMLECGMSGSLVQHFFQRLATRFHKVAFEPSHCLLLWRRRNDNTRIVSVQSIVQPKEIAISPLHLEIGLFVGF